MDEGTLEVHHGKPGKAEFLTGLIASLSLSERNLSLSALDFQSMGLAKKHQIEAAIDRAAELGKLLDVIIENLRKITCDQLGYRDEANYH